MARVQTLGPHAGTLRATLTVVAVLGGIVLSEFVIAVLLAQGSATGLRGMFLLLLMGSGLALALFAGFYGGFGALYAGEMLYSAAYDGRMRDEGSRRIERVRDDGPVIAIALFGIALLVIGLLLR